MPKRGRTTEVPGLSRDGKVWILRAVVKGPDGRRWERQKQVDGATERPTRAQLKVVTGLLEQLRQELLKEATQAARGLGTRMTVGDFAERWIEHLVATGKAREHVVDKNISRLETFVLPFIGDLEVMKLRRAAVAKWMDDVTRMRQPNGKLYGKSTLMGAWAVLRAMLRKAVVMLDLEYDPTHLLKLEVGAHIGTEERPSRKPKETITLDELGRLLVAARSESPDIAAMLAVEFSTGMRFCEVSGLWWQDIDLDAGKLRIERSQVEGKVGPPKTEETRRDVFLAPEVVEVLRVHRQWQIDQQVDGLAKGLVFPSTTGGYRNPAVLTKPLKRCCARAGIDKHLSSHCLRKTANNLIRQANGDTVARSMIGHSTSEMTRLYSNVDVAERSRAHKAAFGAVFAKVQQPVGQTGGTDGESH